MGAAGPRLGALRSNAPRHLQLHRRDEDRASAAASSVPWQRGRDRRRLGPPPHPARARAALPPRRRRLRAVCHPGRARELSSRAASRRCPVRGRPGAPFRGRVVRRRPLRRSSRALPRAGRGARGDVAHPPARRPLLRGHRPAQGVALPVGRARAHGPRRAPRRGHLRKRSQQIGLARSCPRRGLSRRAHRLCRRLPSVHVSRPRAARLEIRRAAAGARRDAHRGPPRILLHGDRAQMSGTAIRADHVSKTYKLRRERSRTLKETFLRQYAPTERVQALRDVSFAIQPGEAFGVVGANGSGKSTLLKLLAGTAKPTSGTLEVNGRVTALLEIGAGFHPDFSGRENAYLNGSLLGLSRKEMDRVMPAIEDFADIGRFFDAAVKTYSSGMYMRLGFSVAVHLDPDVLLVDEVLAVGDEYFQHKCFAKIEEFRKSERTIVLVSHDLNAVARLCERTLWLNDGTVAALELLPGAYDADIGITDAQDRVYDYHAKGLSFRVIGTSRELGIARPRHRWEFR